MLVQGMILSEVRFRVNIVQYVGRDYSREVVGTELVIPTSQWRQGQQAIKMFTTVYKDSIISMNQERQGQTRRWKMHMNVPPLEYCHTLAYLNASVSPGIYWCRPCTQHPRSRRGTQDCQGNITTRAVQPYLFIEVWTTPGHVKKATVSLM